MTLADALAERDHFARSLAIEAGAVLLRHRGRLGRPDEKAPRDLVTDADRDSERLISAALSRRFPEDRLCLEEADGRAGARERRASLEAAPFTWCVDPLDGTTNFVRGRADFAVSIGLLCEGRPVFGVVHAPARGETFVGGRGVPARLLSGGAEQALHVTEVADLDRALVGTGFAAGDAAVNANTSAVVHRLVQHSFDLRRVGAAALDLCDVAAGRLDAFFQAELGPWDVAAGVAIVEAAGGRVTDYRGAPHAVFGVETLASNGALHEAMLGLIASEAR